MGFTYDQSKWITPHDRDQRYGAELCRGCLDREQEQSQADAADGDGDPGDEEEMARVAEGEQAFAVDEVRVAGVEVGVPGKPGEGGDRAESRKPEGSA